MSMIELAAEPKPKPKPVKKRRKAARRTRPAKAAAPEAPVPADRFPGLTAKNCATDCTEKHCAISGKSVCGHPYKSSVGGGDAVLVERTNAAKKQIAHQRIES